MDPEAAGVTDDVFFFSNPKCGAVQKPQNPQKSQGTSSYYMLLQDVLFFF